ncbi:hypothetical protein ABS198_20200, partial [Acinetobacter baumannii]|uniref:hypothetical protein n=2 Tax=Pseudomonadota TaxID=1224 RepID=UPI00332F294B
AERHLQMIPHNELARVLKGMGTEESWHTLAVRVNVGAMMAKLYFNVEAQEAMTAAVHAVAEAGKRYVTTGKMILTGDESRAIGGGLNLTDEMQLS